MLNTLRVLIVADDPLARGGLAALLGEHCTVVGQAAPEDYGDPVAVYMPDVVLWDLGWDPVAVPDALDDVMESGTPVVALLPDATFVAPLWGAGVRGLLLRNTDTGRLLAALNAVMCDLRVHDPAVAPTLSFAPPVTTAPDLTTREQEVLQLLADGSTNRAIAQQLDISEHTVKFHTNAILGKLRAQSRTEAVVQAIRLGLIHV